MTCYRFIGCGYAMEFATLWWATYFHVTTLWTDLGIGFACCRFEFKKLDVGECLYCLNRNNDLKSF
jgi:hypothetical protein